MTVPAYGVDAVTPLQDGDLYPYLSAAIDGAAKRIWAVIFHVDVRIYKDEALSVRALLKRLAAARWRGVDVRVVVSPAGSEDLHVGNHTSALYLASLGVPVRMFGSSFQSSTHSKYVIIDDRRSIVGSHNWSHRAFHQSIESSVAAESVDLTHALAAEFRSVWAKSTELEER